MTLLQQFQKLVAGSKAKDPDKLRVQELDSRVRQQAVDHIAELLAIVGDQMVEAEPRILACEFLTNLCVSGKAVDKRRAVSPLMRALKSRDSQLRSAAARTLSVLRPKGALNALLKAVREDTDQMVRIWAVSALTALRDSRAASTLMEIMLNTSEDVRVRGVIAENLGGVGGAELIPAYFSALQDELAEIRFWAAFCMATLSQYDGAAVTLPILDRLVAYDTAVPQGWWQVGREAIPAFERLYWLRRQAIENSDCGVTMIISPAVEYFDYSRQSTIWKGDQAEWIPLQQQIPFRLEPVWFTEQLIAAWDHIKLNVRIPRAEALLLDWEVEMEACILSGGIHRDHYALILTGDYDDVLKFAHWYRQVISVDVKLYLYEFGGSGEEIV